MKTATKKPHSSHPDNFWRTIFDANPLPMFVVDDDVKIEEFNRAASGMLHEKKELILRHRAGEVLHCVHALDSPRGCGRGKHCPDCIVRNSVRIAFGGKETHRTMTEMELVQNGKKSKIQLLLTCTPFFYQDKMQVLLILEDVSELAALRRLLPVCAHCKKIRDDKDYWHNIDAYLSEHMDMNFTHGICPDCMQRFLDDFDKKELADPSSPGK